MCEASNDLQILLPFLKDADFIGAARLSDLGDDEAELRYARVGDWAEVIGAGVIDYEPDLAGVAEPAVFDEVGVDDGVEEEEVGAARISRITCLRSIIGTCC